MNPQNSNQTFPSVPLGFSLPNPKLNVNLNQSLNLEQPNTTTTTTMNPHNSNQTFPSAPPGFSLPNPNLNLNLNQSLNLEQPNTTTTMMNPHNSNQTFPSAPLGFSLPNSNLNLNLNQSLNLEQPNTTTTMNPHNSNQTFPSAPPGFSLPNPNLNVNLNQSLNLKQPNTTTTTMNPRNSNQTFPSAPLGFSLPNPNLNLNLKQSLNLEQPNTTTTMNPHNSNQTFPSAPPSFSLPNPNFNLNLNQSLNLEQPNTTTTTTPRMAMIPLVRMTDLGLSEKRQMRDVVRRTRMVYDSVRVLAMAEDEGYFNARRVRSDLKASATMRSRGLWLNRNMRIVGAIPGICIGDVFLYRMELCVVGLHGEPQAGIDYLPGSMSSNGDPIATSVIVSGGYEGDVDEGDVIILSGHGGQDKNRRQVFHQKLEGGDLAMERSMHYGIEVRVIRAVRYEGTSSTSGKVYVYDGLYKIVESWCDVGKSGFGVFKFMLSRIDDQAKMGSLVLKEAFLRRNDPDYKPMCIISPDISNGMERVGIRLFNDIDECKDPMYFEYLPRATFFPFDFHPRGNETGCKCVGSCREGCICFMRNGNSFPYSQSGLLLKGKPVIFECGPDCSCPPHCRNRVTQQGLNHRLEVFRSLETGWGVRSFDLIQAGTFICEYSGVVLTREQAEIMTMSGDSLIYPNRFPNRWTEWGNLSLIDDRYALPSYPSILPLNFALDVSRMRNVACYISHSSTPNLMVQFVVYDRNNQFYLKTMLFAMETIPPLRDFSLDYGVDDDVLIRELAMHN